MDKTIPRPMAQAVSQGQSDAAVRARIADSAEADAASTLLCQPKTEMELERLDGRRGCHYLPMDVFLDAPTRHAHFRVSAVRARLARFRRIGRP